MKAALLSGRDNFHVDKKKGQGIHKLGEILEWATIIGQQLRISSILNSWLLEGLTVSEVPIENLAF